MKKHIMIVLAVSTLVLFGVAFTAMAQETIINLIGDESAEILCDGNSLILERLSKTSVMAHCRPYLTSNLSNASISGRPTPTPIIINTPDSGKPYVGAPLCDDHEVTVWHGLWNAEKGCHYNHEHKSDPFVMNDVFGPPGALYSGNSLSYPWETPGENQSYPDGKHEGYAYETRHAEPACQTGRAENSNCITDFRIQYHLVGSAKGAATRFHSYFSEARICDRDMQNCGILKTGGWSDYGILSVPYKGEHIPLPTDSDCGGECNVHVAPYRGHVPADREADTSPATWVGSHGRYGYNLLVHFNFRSEDQWGGVYPDDPFKLHLRCPDYQCQYNNSTVEVFGVVATVPGALDTDGDGLVTYSGYTDRKGNIVEGCTAPGFDCVPLEIVNAPVGRADWAEQVPHLNLPEYDVSPYREDGSREWWIEYPN